MNEAEVGSIGFKRSGVGAGDVDFSIRPYEIEKMSPTDRSDLKSTVKRFSRSILDQIYELETGKKKFRLFDLNFFKGMVKKPGAYKYWPIKFNWVNHPGMKVTTFFQGHGFQVGSSKKYSRVYGWTLHLGNFKITFGERKRSSDGD